MDLASVLLSITILYAAIFFIDSHLKAKNPRRYQQWKQHFNISISPMSLRWSTASCNKFLTSVGLNLSFLDWWFRLGAILTSMLILPCTILLISTLVNSFQNFWIGSTQEVVLQAVLPGVNLPWSHFIHYFITLAICTVFHEMGHALAAVREQVPIIGVGFLSFLIMPAAFVEISTMALETQAPSKQLRIYSAGVWHNLVLSAVAYASCVGLPILAQPFFIVGKGVSVLNLSEPPRGAHWFFVGDQLTAVDDCSVIDSATWRSCLISAMQHPQQGYCIEEDKLIHPGNESMCCGEEVEETHLCFVRSHRNDMFCLRARSVIDASQNYCEEDKTCGKGWRCLTPQLNFSESSRLMQVKRSGSSDVLYFGEPGELHSLLDVHDFVPRTWSSSLFVLSFTQNLLSYIFSFSAGLAVLNVVPCKAMDGQHIVMALCDLFLPFTGFHQTVVKQFIKLFVYLGTSLVALNVIVGLVLLLPS